MLNVLFWNLHRNALEDLIETCVVENDIDVAIFSEFDGVDIDKIEEHLGKMYKHIFEIQNNKKVTLIAKNTLYVSIVQPGERFNIYSVKTGVKDYLLVAIHLEDRRNYKTADKGWILNVYRYLRKKRNKNNKNYFSCNTYSEWKDYILDKVNRNINNYDDLIHFLIRERNRQLINKEAIVIILIPIYISLIATAIGNMELNMLVTVAIIIVIELLALNGLYNINQKVNFYNDLVEVLKIGK